MAECVRAETRRSMKQQSHFRLYILLSGFPRSLKILESPWISKHIFQILKILEWVKGRKIFELHCLKLKIEHFWAFFSKTDGPKTKGDARIFTKIILNFVSGEEWEPWALRLWSKWVCTPGVLPAAHPHPNYMGVPPPPGLHTFRVWIQTVLVNNLLTSLLGGIQNFDTISPLYKAISSAHSERKHDTSHITSKTT